jgi:hypothetical protein
MCWLLTFGNVVLGYLKFVDEIFVELHFFYPTHWGALFATHRLYASKVLSLATCCHQSLHSYTKYTGALTFGDFCQHVAAV